MRTRSPLLVCAGVVLLLLVCVTATNAAGVTAIKIPGAGWAVGDSDVTSEDLEKQVRNARDLASSEEAERQIAADAAGQPPADFLDPFPSQGTANAIGDLKRAAVALLERDLRSQSYNISDDQASRLTRATYAADVADRELRALLKARADVASGKLPNTEFTDSEIQVRKWLGVDAEGQKGVALFKGTQRLLWKGHWDDRDYLWRLDLVEENGEWQVHRLTFADLEW